MRTNGPVSSATGGLLGTWVRQARTAPSYAFFRAVPVGVTLELVVTMGIEAGVTAKRRRCEFKRCRRLLPKDASPRRRFCGPNCVAGAYRMRRRREHAHILMTTIVDDKALEFLYSDEGYHSRLLAWQTCGGPTCRAVLWAGVRRRSNSRYCSAKCRQAAYRERQRARNDHDAAP